MGIEREFHTNKGAEAPRSDPVESRRIVCDVRLQPMYPSDLLPQVTALVCLPLFRGHDALALPQRWAVIWMCVLSVAVKKSRITPAEIATVPSAKRKHASAGWQHENENF